MAQRSKKNHIATSALPLFLQNGFKGTSIDMVVKQSGVSKPTVYNNFPDKAALMHAVMQHWCDSHKPVIMPIHDREELDEFIHIHWLTAETVRLYALVIGEGWRFPEAKKLFWDQYDSLWRRAFSYLADQSSSFNQESIELHLDQELMHQLRTL